MEIHIVEKINGNNEYFAFIGTNEKSFKINNKGDITSKNLSLFERKAILKLFKSLKISKASKYRTCYVCNEKKDIDKFSIDVSGKIHNKCFNCKEKESSVKLLDVKDTYAKINGYKNWDELLTNTNDIDCHIDKLCVYIQRRQRLLTRNTIIK